MITLLNSEVGAMIPYQSRMSGTIIDLGGGQNTCSGATHVVDLYTKPQWGTWIQGDICDPDLYKQFSDKQFDWVYCNHTVEDVYNPFIILKEAQRIAKRGLFGMPHWSRELTVQSDRDDWETIVGWPHHHWLIGISQRDGALEFFPKLSWIVQIGWETTTHNINLEWDGGDFPVRLAYEYPGASRCKELAAWLKERWTA